MDTNSKTGVLFFFFFSSRRRHTRFWRDWRFRRVLFRSMLIWYLALAWMMRGCGPIVLPRRLVWVVNRRVVVDQATEEAEKLRDFDTHQDQFGALQKK